MNDKSLDRALSRRQLMGRAAGGLATGLLPLKGWRGDEGKSSSNTTLALASSGPVGKRVVVVGGGMAGMTAAKYLRLWGGTGVQVTLVEPDASYTSSIMSNLVLNGSRSIASLQFKRDALATKYGVQFESGSVAVVNAASQTVSLAGGRALSYDRLVLAPGVSFDRRLRPDSGGLRHAHAARLARRCADHVAAQPDRGNAQWRCVRDDHPQVTLSLPARALRAGLRGRRLPQEGQGHRLQGDRARRELEHSSGEAHLRAGVQRRSMPGIIQYVPGVTSLQIDATTKRGELHRPIGCPPGRAGDGGQSDRSTPRRGQCHRGWLAQAGLNNGGRRTLGRRSTC